MFVSASSVSCASLQTTQKTFQQINIYQKQQGKCGLIRHSEVMSDLKLSAGKHPLSVILRQQCLLGPRSNFPHIFPVENFEGLRYVPYQRQICCIKVMRRNNFNLAKNLYSHSFSTQPLKQTAENLQPQPAPTSP